MQKIVMLKGLPASGKSNWSKEKVKQGGYLRISMDDLRASAFGGWSIKKEKACLRMRDDLVRFAIKEGKSAIIDATNLNPKHEYRLRALAEELGVQFVINNEFLKVSPEECIERDLHRGDAAVGSKVIWEMYDKWIRPSPMKILEKEKDKRRCVIVDLDGTLAIKVSDRSYYDMDRVGEDAPDPLMAFIVDCISNAGEFYADVVLVTGRSEEGREATEKWLEDNCIDYAALYMRKTGDRRKDVEVKEEILKNEILPKYAVVGAIDNSLRCATMYYDLGITTLKAGNPQAEH